MGLFGAYALAYLLPAAVLAAGGALLARGRKPGEERGRDRLARVLLIGGALWAVLGAVVSVQNARSASQSAGALMTSAPSASGRVVLRGDGFEVIALNPDAALPQIQLERADAGH